MSAVKQKKVVEKMKLDMDAYLPLRDVVFQTLREAIFKGELRPGERLMELQLAKRLGVSRTPIREAIRMLELEGLAVTVPRKGAEVARMTEKEMEDVLQIRRALDELAVGLACDNMTEEAMGKIYIALKNFEKRTKGGDVKATAQADVDFHDAIYQASNNPKLVNMLNNLRGQMYRYRVEYLKDQGIYPRLMEEHKRIYEGLKHRDKETVVEIVSCHVMNQEIVIKNMIQGRE